MLRPLRLTDHPALKIGLVAWGFQGNEGNSWENEESKCLVIRCSFCYAGNSFRLEKKISDNNSLSSTGVLYKFF